MACVAFTLTSSAFQDGQRIPAQYTCEGTDTSPPLQWSGAPPGTIGFAMVMDDPDAPRGTWTHWTWWDLSPTITSLPPGADVARLGAVEGTTSAVTVGYHGPCPPTGAHRYVFTLYALLSPLGLREGAAIMDVHRRLAQNALESCTLTGTYQRA